MLCVINQVEFISLCAGLINFFQNNAWHSNCDAMLLRSVKLRFDLNSFIFCRFAACKNVCWWFNLVFVRYVYVSVWCWPLSVERDVKPTAHRFVCNFWIFELYNQDLFPNYFIVQPFFFSRLKFAIYLLFSIAYRSCYTSNVQRSLFAILQLLAWTYIS